MENVLKSSGLVLLNSQNYNRWQYEQFRPYVGKTVLEIGCGLGNLSQYLKEDAQFLLSVDIKPEAVAFIKERFPETPDFKVELLDVFQEGLKDYAQHPFDTIVFSNVLEHIEDDAQAIQRCHDILQPTGGKLLLLVPAHKFLYGSLDAEAGHYRRYSRKQIINLAKETGFNVLDLYPFNITGALGWFFNFCLLKRKGTSNSPEGLQMNFYDRFLVKPGRFLEGMIKPPIGISYIAILEAEK